MAKKRIKVRVTFNEKVLGTASSNPEIHKEFIASKGPNAISLEEEIAALGPEIVEGKLQSVFPRMDDGRPMYWDYQIKGSYKDACGMLARLPDTQSKKLRAYKKIIDGLIFVFPRRIPINLPEGGKIGSCQRPLRITTMQGERVALANSEVVPEGSWIEYETLLLDDTYEKCLIEWLDYGALRGFGQWRNSGTGRFSYEIL